MKVYIIYTDYYGYDQYDSIIVTASNEERALAMAKAGNYFEKNQGEIHIEEVNMDKEYVVLKSFNAG